MMINIPATVDEALELAAKHLPRSYQIMLTVENEGYAVCLYTPDFSDISLDGGCGMRSDIIEGINKAIELSKAGAV